MVKKSKMKLSEVSLKKNTRIENFELNLVLVLLLYLDSQAFTRVS